MDQVRMNAQLTTMTLTRSKKQSQMQDNPEDKPWSEYDILLREKEQFFSLDSDYQAIYKNFSFLSYLNGKLGIQIIYQYTSAYDENIKFDIFRCKQYHQHQNQIKMEKQIPKDGEHEMEQSEEQNAKQVEQEKIKYYCLIQYKKDQFDRTKIKDQNNPLALQYYLMIPDLGSELQPNFATNGSTPSLQNQVIEKIISGLPNIFSYNLFERDELQRDRQNKLQKNLQTDRQNKLQKNLQRERSKEFVKNIYNKLEGPQRSQLDKEIKQYLTKDLEGEKKCQNNQFIKTMEEFFSFLKSTDQKNFPKIRQRFYQISCNFKYQKAEIWKEEKNQETDQQNTEIKLKLQKTIHCILAAIKSQIPIDSFYNMKNIFVFDETKPSTVHFPLVEGQNQYLYKEPSNIRVKKHEDFDRQHYSIALQGGGVKGISYIGAYKSFVEHFKKQNKDAEKLIDRQINIKSVIGSSAGGILGLAICTGLDAEQIQDICIRYLTNVPKEDKKYPEFSIKGDREDDQFTKSRQQLRNLRKFFENTKIVDKDVLDLIQTVLSKKEVQDALIEVLDSQPSFKELLTSKQVTSEEQKLFIFGLLMGSLMKGKKIKQICIEMIALYLKQKVYAKKNIHLDQMEFIRHEAQKLTMKQFYEYTGIEFTCTSVDLDDQILRFFNQKTTPHLPVCCAVQMTGSFPVGFEAQKWKKEWGKYYIHYKNSKRQKNLINSKTGEGHQFTDGGMLANFPVKYLDNPNMRQKYFSHPVNQHTKIYGFGLYELDEFSREMEADETQNQEIKQIKQREGKTMSKARSAILKNIFLDGSAKNPLNYLGLAVSIGKNTVKTAIDVCSRNSQFLQLGSFNSFASPFQYLKEVKLIKFGIKLLNTYMKSKDNLTKQCFAYTAIQLQNQFVDYSQKIYQNKLKKLEKEENKKRIQNAEKLSDQAVIKTLCTFIEKESIKKDFLRLKKEKYEQIKNFLKQKEDSIVAKYPEIKSKESFIKDLKDSKEKIEKLKKVFEKNQDKSELVYLNKLCELIDQDSSKLKLNKDAQQQENQRKMLNSLSYFFHYSDERIKNPGRMFRQLQKFCRPNQPAPLFLRKLNTVLEKYVHQQNFTLKEVITALQQEEPMVFLREIAKILETKKDQKSQKNYSSTLDNREKQILKIIMEYYFVKDMPHIEHLLEDKGENLWSSYENFARLIFRHAEFNKIQQALIQRIPKEDMNVLQVVESNLDKILFNLDLNIKGTDFSQKVHLKNLEQVHYAVDPMIIEIQRYQQNSRTFSDELTKLKKILDDILEKESHNIFIHGNLKARAQFIKEKINEVKKIMKNISNSQQGKNLYQNIFKEQKKILKILCQKILKKKLAMEKIINIIWRKMKESKDLKKDKQLIKFINDIDLNLLEFGYEQAQPYWSTAQQLYTAYKDDSSKFINSLRDCQIRQIRTCNSRYKLLLDLHTKFESVLLKNTSEKTFSEVQNVKINLLFESSVKSQKYLLKLCEQIAFKIQNINLHASKSLGNEKRSYKKYRINSITGSYYNAIAMFLFVSNIDPSKIEKKMNEITNIMQFDQKALEYDKFQWTESTSVKIKNIFDYLYAEEHKISLKEFEKKYKSLEKNEMIEELQKQRKIMNAKINTFLELITEGLSQIDIRAQNDPIKRQLEMKNIFSCTKARFQELEIEGLQTKRLWSWVLDKFKDIILYVALATPFVIQQLQYQVVKKNRKDIWKGILICGAFKLDRVKQFINKTLSELSLDEDITLKQFYQVSHKKIKLNFTVADLNKQCIEFFNYRSTPQMPLRAALMSCMSLPLFMRHYTGESFWKYRLDTEHDERKLLDYFNQQKQIHPKYCSGDILSKIPLELLSNIKIKKIINGENKIRQKSNYKGKENDIFFMINFKSIATDQENVTKRFYFMNYKDNINIKTIKRSDFSKFLYYKFTDFFKYRMGGLGLPFSSFFGVEAMKQRQNVITMYVNSHDNLIKNTYKSELVELPIRVGTLDFYKIADSQNQTKLSLQAKDVILQAQCVMREKLLNVTKCYRLQQEEGSFKQSLLRIGKIQKNLFLEKDVQKKSEGEIIEALNSRYRLEKERRLLIGRKFLLIKIENFYPIYSCFKKKKLADNQYYIRFLSFYSNSKDLQQKHKIYIRYRKSEPWIEVSTEYWLMKEKAFFLKIEFPLIIYQVKEDAQKELSLQVEKVKNFNFVHKIQVPEIIYRRKEQFRCCYQVPYNYFIRDQSKKPSDKKEPLKIEPLFILDGSQRAIKIQTVLEENEEYKGSKYLNCPNCYSSCVNKQLIEKEQSYKCDKCEEIYCAQKNSLRFVCAKCKQKHFCFFCAYKLMKNHSSDDNHANQIYCRKDKQMHVLNYGMISQLGDRQMNECSGCGMVPIRFYFDKKCDIVICEHCKKTLLLKNHYR